MTTFATVGQTTHRRRDDDAHLVAVTDTQNRNGTNEKVRLKPQDNRTDVDKDDEEEDPELLRAKQIALAVSSRGAAGLMSPAEVRSIVRADVRQSRIVEEWKREHMSVTRRLEESLTEGVRRVEESILDRLEPNRPHQQQQQQQQQQQHQRGNGGVGGGGGGVFVARGGVLVKDDDDSLDGVSPQTMTRSLRTTTSSTATLTAQKQQPERARTRAGEQSSRLSIPTASASNHRTSTATAANAAATTTRAVPSAQPAVLHNQPQKATTETLSSLSLQTSPHTPPNPTRTAVASFSDNNLPPPPPHQHQQQRRRTSSSGSGIIQLTPNSRRAIKGKPKYRKVFSSSSSSQQQHQQHNQHSISPSSSSSSSPQRRHSPRHSAKRTIEEDDDVRRAKLLAMVVSSNPNMTGDEVKMAREVANRKLAQARTRKQQQQHHQQQQTPAAAAAHSSTRPEVTDRREDGSVVVTPTAQQEGRVGSRIVTRSASAPVTVPATAATAAAEVQANTAAEIDTTNAAQQQQKARTINTTTWRTTLKATTACLILKPMSNAWNKIPNSFSLTKSNGIYLLLLLNWSILYSSWYGSFWFSALIANGALFFCLRRHDNDGSIAIGAGSVSSMSREATTTTASSSSQSRVTSHSSSGESTTTTATQPQMQGEVEERIEALFREAVRSLLQSHPDATSAECRRFLTANDGNVDKASERLSKYLKWRSDCGLISSSSSSSLHQEEGAQGNDQQEKCSSDEEDWDRAASLAVKIVNSNGSVGNGTNKQKGKANGSEKLPRLVNVPTDIKNNDATPASSPDSSSSTNTERQQPAPPQLQRQRGRKRIRARDGTRLIHVLPAQIDSTIAEPSTYALAVSIYLDSKLDRNSTEKVTVIIDVRGGIGWSNPKPVTVIPFIKCVTKLLNDHFPERLERCILFPLPRAATYLWRMVKAFLDPGTARKMEVLGGPGDVKSSVPKSVVKFLDDDASMALEERRVSLFRC